MSQHIITIKRPIMLPMISGPQSESMILLNSLCMIFTSENKLSCLTYCVKNTYQFNSPNAALEVAHYDHVRTLG